MHTTLPTPKQLYQEKQSKGSNFAQILDRLRKVIVHLHYEPTPFGLALFSKKLLSHLCDGWSDCVHLLWARSEDGSHSVLKLGVCRYTRVMARTLQHTRTAASHGFVIAKLVRLILFTEEDWLARRVEERTHVLMCAFRPQFKGFAAEWYDSAALDEIHQLLDEAVHMSLENWKKEDEDNECVTMIKFGA